MIPFNRPYASSTVLNHMERVCEDGYFKADGRFTKLCQDWIVTNIGCKKALLTHSCTGALEMIAILMNLSEGDEIIMPSFTFTSTATVFALHGGVPVFVDIKAEDLNIDETKIEDAITDKTRAIIVVHYAGVSCNMDPILHIARKYNLLVIEDAAHALLSTTSRGINLGSLSDMAGISFHESKNIHCGEGGVLLINNTDFVEKAEMIRNCGIDRSKFINGEVDKYTWKEPGSKFLMNELSAAFLWSQLTEAKVITSNRVRLWHYYYNKLEELEKAGYICRPKLCSGSQSAHIFFIHTNSKYDRKHLIHILAEDNIEATTHYAPLHLSEAGQALCKTSGNLNVTVDVSDKLVRLPLWYGLTTYDIDYIVESIRRCYAG